MDFSKYELSEELRATLAKDYEADISGLKSKNTDLIQREKTQKEANEALIVQMSTQEEDQKVALAEKEGTVEQYKNAIAERDQKLETVTREFQETENKRLIDSSISDFSSSLADDPAGKMYMQSLYGNSIEIKDGVVVSKDATKTVEDLRQSFISDKANAKYIRANVGSGTGSAGSTGSGSANTNLNAADKARTERAERRKQKFN